jgi:hypothetical protein
MIPPEPNAGGTSAASQAPAVRTTTVARARAKSGKPARPAASAKAAAPRLFKAAAVERPSGVKAAVTHSAKSPKAPKSPAKAGKAAKPAKVPKAATLAKPGRVKLVRDSFTLPKSDIELLAALKQRVLKQGREAKKSELVRAGIHALAALDDAAFGTAVAAVPRLKTGRPQRKTGGK